MKTLVVYYSYTGKTRKEAESIAKEKGADIIEVKERKRRSVFNAFVFGSLAARGQKQADILPVSIDFSTYDKIIIAMPIWAGYPAPAINNVIELLPRGKDIELILTSGGGSSKASMEKTKALFEAKGCKVVKYTDKKID